MTRMLLVFLLLAGCDDDPATVMQDMAAAGDGGGACPMPPVFTEDVSSCVPAATDYRPRVNLSMGDSWPACISDDNVFHPINPSIGSIARTQAFEDIGAKLWAGDKRPSANDFVDARVLYAVDQGIDSRVQRRADVHYPAPPGGESCGMAGIPEQYPDRCVGPNKLLPILNDAFQKGAAGTEPRVQAARIEAALVWFFYASVMSEVMSCTQTPQDCDSCWAYSTGGTPRPSPIGLGRYVRALGVETHDRVYDGNLAVRCWRNLDNETGTATNTALRDQAFAQIDKALIRGVALILRQRFSELACTTGEVRAARLAFIATLGPFLDRAARERDVMQADVLKAQVAAGDAADIARAQRAIDILFPCP